VGSPPLDHDAFDAFEAAGWEEKAGAYERFFGGITDRVVAPLLDAASVGVGTRVLDVATGPGWVAARAAELGASVVGIDVAEAMIARARAAHPGAEFRRADAQELPFADATFDAVTISFALRNVVDTEAALHELARVTRPGGRLVVCEFSHPVNSAFRTVYLQYLMRSLPAVARGVSSNPEAYVYLAESIRAWPDQAGLAARVKALTAGGLAHIIDTGGGFRLRTCHRAGCGTAFLDTSRNGLRRFCSLRCANQVNVANHRRRKTAVTPAG